MHIKHGGFFIVDFAEIVAHALDFEPFACGVDHFPPRQIVERRAPENGFFAARVHRHIAAHAGSIGRSGIHRKHKLGGIGGFFHAPRDHARAAMNHRPAAFETGQLDIFHAIVFIELFGVDHRAHGIERHGAAGVAGAAAARDDGELQINQRAHQGRHFGFGVGVDHHKGIFHAPVGGVGDMRHARQAVKHNIVFFGDFAQTLENLLAAGFGFVKAVVKARHRRFSGLHEQSHLFVVVAPFVDFAQTVTHFFHQRFAAGGVVEQIINQIGVAHHRPNIAQHFKQHARRAAGYALAAQRLQRVPRIIAEQADDDFAVGI